MTDLVCDKELILHFASLTPAPILSDETLEYLGNVYQEEAAIRREAFFEVFLDHPARYLGGVRPVEHALPTEAGRRLLPRQRRVSAAFNAVG